MAAPTLDQQSFTALATLSHLIPKIQDELTALDNIEMVVDAIDIVVELVENNKMSDETGKAAAVDYLLKMLKSPCAEVVKLALSGLDRLMARREVAVYSGRIGAFEQLAQVIIRADDSKEYEKTKASDVLAFLMAPADNKFIKTTALRHKVFDTHLQMILSSNQKYIERALQFFWCITDNNKDAGEKILGLPEIFPIVLRAIADADCGRNALRLLNNLSRLDNAKKKLPVAEITALVKPVLRIPDKQISKKDKAITALTVANLTETGTPVDRVLIEYLRDIVKELLDGTLKSSKLGLPEVVACFHNLASKEENKVILAECGIIKTLIALLMVEESNLSYSLGPVKEHAAKAIWYMAYNETVRKKMQEQGVVDILNRLLAVTVDEKIKKNLKDTIWIFEVKGEKEKMTNLKTKASSPNASFINQPSSPSQAPHAQNTSPQTYSPAYSPSVPVKTVSSEPPKPSIPPTTVKYTPSPAPQPQPTNPAYSPSNTPKYTPAPSQPTPSNPPVTSYSPSVTPKYTPAPSQPSPSNPPTSYTPPKYTPPPSQPSPNPVVSSTPKVAPPASPSPSPASNTANKPAWMGTGGGARPTPSPAPTPSPVVAKAAASPSGVPLSSGKTPLVSASGEKPKWLVTK